MSKAALRAAARLIGLLAVSASTRASAQSGAASTSPRGALDQFDPAPAGDGFFSVSSASVPGHLRVAAQLTASYAREPLVLRHSRGTDQLDWVREQSLLHVQASLEALGRLKLDLDLPVALAEGGVSGGLGGILVTAPSGAGAGDFRATLRIPLLAQNQLIPGAALTFALFAPLGDAGSFRGAGLVRYQPGLVIGAESPHVAWAVSVGARFQPESSASILGSRVVGGAAVVARWAGITVGPELRYAFNVDDPLASIVTKSASIGAEVLLGARYQLGFVSFGIAGGPGLAHSPGTPTYRLVASMSGTFETLSTHAPRDTAAGARTGTVSKPSAALSVRPESLDSDGDGVADLEDACPNVVGDARPGVYRRGCPSDRDRDGIPDAEDHCPTVHGVESHDVAKNGCPPDSDSDGITDDKDACPLAKGPPSADATRHGCPSVVRVEGKQIVILQQINFETGRAEIKKDSFSVLEQVAGVLKGQPAIARIAVDGHTDDRGGDQPNLSLSERRAVAVVRWLTEHGIDARRLEARGFGQRRPIADNTTEAGRAKNRRVEFQIRRRSDKGEAGWKDGPIDETLR